MLVIQKKTNTWAAITPSTSQYQLLQFLNKGGFWSLIYFFDFILVGAGLFVLLKETRLAKSL